MSGQGGPLGVFADPVLYLKSTPLDAKQKCKTDLEDDERRRRKHAKLRQKVIEEMEQMASPFDCPITKILMKCPVTASDGFSYEKAAIKQHIKENDDDARSPMTNLLLANHKLTPNQTLEKSIDEAIEDRMNKMVEEQIEKRMYAKTRQPKSGKTQHGGSSSGKR